MRLLLRTGLGQSLLLAFALFVIFTAGLPAVGSAATPSPAFSVHSIASPSHFAPGDSTGNSGYAIEVKNIGAGPTDGTPITIAAALPAGVSVHPGPAANSTQLSLSWNGYVGNESLCDPGPPVSCTTPATNDGNSDRVDPVLKPSATLVMYVPVDVAAALDGASATTHVTVSGGGAPPVSAIEQTPVSAEPASFGFQDSAFSLTDGAGNPSTQAGSHPYQLSTYFLLNSAVSGGQVGQVADLKDVKASLPPGLVVNPQATPVRCTEAQLEANDGDTALCPNGSAVGYFRAVATLFGSANPGFTGAVFNMVPPPGVPAEFGFVYAAVGSEIFVHIRGGLDSAGDYRLTADASDLVQFGGATGVDLELWGSPSDPGHDSRRGQCAAPIHYENGGPVVDGDCPVAATETPLLTMPSACSGPLQTSFSADSWQDPGNFISTSAQTQDSSGDPVGVNGCSTLDFNPTLTAQPTTTAADSPTGLDVDLQVPQTNSMATPATANLKRTVVDLPAGMVVNPSAADGLGSCSPAQIGLTTPLGQTQAHFTAQPDTCPDSAKIGTVTIVTPLLPDPLQGSVYLAQQAENPFSSLLALYITVKDPATGIVIKLPGKVSPDPVTGQLRATFDETPQLPFSDFQLHFSGGNRATLITPPTCGDYQTTSQFAPWSAADPDNPTPAETVTSTDSFAITTGPGGAPCPDYLDPNRFLPSFSAGTVSPIAGSFSPFVLKVSRPDGEQSLKQIDVALPPGLTGVLAGIPRCAQASIVAGVGGSTNCPAASRVGSVNVSAGAGNTPFFLQNQPVYLTDGYDGAPFGLAIDTHALAGPFDLGHVVVRSKLLIDPSTAQVSADAESLPNIIQGIPLHVRSVTLLMDRANFVLNPTNCNAMTVTGQITGGGADFANPADDTVKQVSDRFQVGGCASLPFKPVFSASTSGMTSKANGASLVVKVSQKPGEANIHKVDLTLPLVLPARLTTLQKACTEAQFNTNPAGCPAGSVIGSATARTPLLNAALSGPAYLVSHGGAAFPDVEFILQANERGGNVQIVLDGRTDIKKGITYSRFETVPDAPISSFETVLPQGPHSALAAYGDLCATTKTTSVRKRVTVRVHGRAKRLTRTVKQIVPQPLTMPTTIVGQNGAQIAQNTKIAVTGCPKAKKAKAKKTAKGKSKAKKGKKVS